MPDTWHETGLGTAGGPEAIWVEHVRGENKQVACQPRRPPGETLAKTANRPKKPRIISLSGNLIAGERDRRGMYFLQIHAAGLFSVLGFGRLVDHFDAVVFPWNCDRTKRWKVFHDIQRAAGIPPAVPRPSTCARPRHTLLVGGRGGKLWVSPRRPLACWAAGGRDGSPGMMYP